MHSLSLWEKYHMSNPIDVDAWYSQARICSNSWKPASAQLSNLVHFTSSGDMWELTKLNKTNQNQQNAIGYAT